MTNGEKFIHDNLTSIPYFVDNKVLLNMEFDAEWWNAEYKEPTDDLSSPLEKNSKLEKGTTKNDLGVDCIDRQATLDAIIKRLGIKNETYLLEAERAIYQQILAMPSVTPQEPTTKNDLGVNAISREKAIAWAEFYIDIYDAKKANELIMGMLRDLPPVTPQLSSGTRKNSQKLEKDFDESDCISRQSVSKYIDYILNHGMGKKKSFDFIKKIVAHLPSVAPQEPTTKNDLALIHTDGLDEGIRCAMCANSIKSDRGCDGGCVVNNAMYKEVMDVIENHIVDTDKMIEPTTKNDLEVEKIIDELEKEFEKVNIPIMDKLTLFAKTQNALYRCADMREVVDE